MLQNVPLMCICNKMDMLNDITKQEVEDTVRQIVNDKFPTTQDVPVRFFGARKVCLCCNSIPCDECDYLLCNT